MSERDWGVVGCGTIGGPLIEAIAQTPELGLAPEPALIVRSGGIMSADGVTPYGARDFDHLARLHMVPEVMVVACPSTDDGQPALDIIRTALRAGGVVVTC